MTTGFYRISRRALLPALCTAFFAVGCITDDAETIVVRELVAVESADVIPATGDTAEIQVYSNGRVRVEQLNDTGDWAYIDQFSFTGDRKIAVTMEENTSFRRMVKLRFVLEGTALCDTVCVKQEGVIPMLECAAPYKSIKGSEPTYSEFELDTNIPLEDFTVTTTYIGQGKDWIDEVAPEQGSIVVSALPNAGDTANKAVVNLTYVDGWDQTLAANLYITQADRDDEFGLVKSFAEVRAMASVEGAVIEDDILIEGVVISDFHSKNMALNPSISYETVDTSVSDRTAYIQNEEGSLGFRLQFDSAADNVLVRGTRLTLSLNGTTLLREDDPERYTISGLAGENMVESHTGGVIAAKTRKIAELIDADIYTWVSLQNTEFFFKQGSYANVYEGYAVKSDLNKHINDNSRMDTWASLLVDGDGNSIYAPVNMLCQWRRTGNGVPQGVGATNGIIVHGKMPRYGNVGRYQIRVLDESGFAQERDGASAYTVFAQWDGDPYQYKFSQYMAIDKRYTYQQYTLESITPSDDISASKPTPNAELFCENHAVNSTRTQYPMSGTTIYNGTVVGDDAKTQGASTKYKGYRMRADVKGWYQWTDGEITGYNGLRIEFSTAGLSGERMLVGFSFSAGEINAKSSKSYPAHWCVEYSTDGGATYTLCKNAVTGGEYVHLHTLPWWDASLGGNKYCTCSSAGMGATDHTFVVPSDLFGCDKAMVRIRPYDKVMTVLPLTWDGDTETAEVSAMTTYDNSISFDNITLSYK